MNSVAVFADSALITQMAFPPAVQIVVVSNVTALTEAAQDACLTVIEAAREDGRRAIPALRGLHRPILAVGPATDPGGMDACFAAGASDFIALPAPESLASKTRKWCELGTNAIDRATFAVLRELTPQDPRRFLGELVALFQHDIPAGLRDLRSHLNADQRIELKRTAHAMKSSAGNLGALRVQSLAEHLEQRASEAGADHVETILQRLEEDYLAALGELTRLANA